MKVITSFCLQDINLFDIMQIVRKFNFIHILPQKIILKYHYLMKSKLNLLLLVMTFGNYIHSQNLLITFDKPFDYNQMFQKDTFRNLKPWQIGVPDKSVFKYENNHRRVFITDSITSLSGNDTFSSILKYVRKIGSGASSFKFRFEYRMNGINDDKGIIEVSPDMGKSWVNILELDTTYDIVWKGKKPVFKGNSDLWDTLNLDMSSWINFDDYPLKMVSQDTILFRFTFVTDNSVSIRDGWMIDNITFEYNWSSIHLVQKNEGGFLFYPNPANTIVSLKSTLGKFATQVDIFNQFGIRCHSVNGDNVNEIDTRLLTEGIYTVIITDDSGQNHTQKLVICR